MADKDTGTKRGPHGPQEPRKHYISALTGTRFMHYILAPETDWGACMQCSCGVYVEKNTWSCGNPNCGHKFDDLKISYISIFSSRLI